MNYLGDAVVTKSKQKFVNDLSEVMVKKSGTYPWGAPKINPFDIQKVIYNNPATIVIWEDGTKTVVKCSEDEEFDCEKGLAMCFAKKALGNKGNYYNIFHRYCDHNWKDILYDEEANEASKRRMGTLRKMMMLLRGSKWVRRELTEEEKEKRPIEEEKEKRPIEEEKARIEHERFLNLVLPDSFKELKDDFQKKCDDILEYYLRLHEKNWYKPEYVSWRKIVIDLDDLRENYTHSLHKLSGKHDISDELCERCIYDMDQILKEVLIKFDEDRFGEDFGKDEEFDSGYWYEMYAREKYGCY